MPDPVRVALCGLGDAGRLHARALAGAMMGDREVRWTAIAGRSDAGVAKFRDDLALPPSVRGFASLEALLDADACDAVILATPDGLHAAQAIACIERGRHVLVEKPLAPTRAQAETVVAAARAAGVVVETGYHLRHHAGHRAVKAQLGTLVGPVRHVAISWAWPDPATDGWRARGDGARFWSLSALGTHAIDLVTWFTGAAIARVSAVTEPASGIDRAAIVGLQLDSGALAQVACAVTHRAPPRVVIAGDLGEVEALATLGAHGAGELRHRPVTPRGAVHDVPFTAVDPYAAQLRAFVRRIAAGDTAPDASLIGNVEALDRIEAARSSRT